MNIEDLRKHCDCPEDHKLYHAMLIYCPCYELTLDKISQTVANMYNQGIDMTTAEVSVGPKTWDNLMEEMGALRRYPLSPNGPATEFGLYTIAGPIRVRRYSILNQDNWLCVDGNAYAI